MIRFIDIYKAYDNGTKALKGISMRIDDGEFVFLVGPSGSGKSTIIKLITAEVAPTDGRLMVNGYNLNTIRPRQVPYMRRTLGVIFQDFRLIEKKSIYDNLVFAMRAVGASPREIKKRIAYVLELVGLDTKADRRPDELSGGEQQRVAIARALNMHPKIMLLDEPTSALDPEMVNEVLDVIKSLAETNMTIVMVTHEMGLARDAADKVVFMENGLVVDAGTPAYLFGPDSNERVQAFLSKIL